MEYRTVMYRVVSQSPTMPRMPPQGPRIQARCIRTGCANPAACSPPASHWGKSEWAPRALPLLSWWVDAPGRVTWWYFINIDPNLFGQDFLGGFIGEQKNIWKIWRLAESSSVEMNGQNQNRCFFSWTYNKKTLTTYIWKSWQQGEARWGHWDPTQSTGFDQAARPWRSVWCGFWSAEPEISWLWGTREP